MSSSSLPPSPGAGAPADASPSRHVPFRGVSNFRDLGGYRGHAGRPVRWRVLFRSDRLSDLHAQDLPAFARLGIRHSVDFRGDSERQASDYAIDQVQRTALPIEPQVTQDLRALGARGYTLDAETAHRMMVQTYEAFVDRNTAQYRAFFDVLLHQQTPLVFHCTAGKDRTGFAAALVLEALGVERASIAHDFMLTNTHYAVPERISQVYSPEAVQVFWRVYPEFLQAAYRQIERRYGSMTGYLHDALGLGAQELQQLRQRYLQAAP